MKIFQFFSFFLLSFIFCPCKSTKAGVFLRTPYSFLRISYSLIQIPDSNSLSASSHKILFKHEQKQNSPLISKMNDEQLARLVDYLFESAYIPSDLWNEVIMEIAKRNLKKTTKEIFDVNVYDLCLSELFVGKPVADTFVGQINNLSYSSSQQDPPLFTNQFPDDTSYIIELENAEHGCFNMPANGIISSPFGYRNKRYHKGIDIQLRKADTITVAFNGIVRFAQKKGGYGNVVIVTHFNGLETLYAHLYKIKVTQGQVIEAGNLIGLAGSTGHSTSTHLHFEVRLKGLPVNPQYFISYDCRNLLYNTVVFKKNSNGILAAFHPETQFHTIEKGETLAEIAIHYGTTIKKLRELNGMSPKQYVRLKQGMILCVREPDHCESASLK